MAALEAKKLQTIPSVEFAEGDRLVIVKEGPEEGQEVVVIDPDLDGLVMVDVGGGRTKTYSFSEVEKVDPPQQDPSTTPTAQLPVANAAGDAGSGEAT